MKKTMKKKGFTLIELILSIALLAIVAIAFSNMFLTGLKGVFNAGHKSKANYISQQALENKISGKPVSIDNVSITSSNEDMEIDFDGIVINVNGSIEIVDYDNGKQKTELVTFVPNP